MMDLMDVSNEIQETLGRSYNVPDDIDEDELMGGKFKCHLNSQYGYIFGQDSNSDFDLLVSSDACENQLE